jgi:prophage regulatory protein
MQPVISEAGRGQERNPQPLHAVQLADALLRITTVTQATGLSSATVYRKLAAGEFPQPVRLGSRCTRWKAADVRAWIQAQGGEQ